MLRKMHPGRSTQEAAGRQLRRERKLQTGAALVLGLLALAAMVLRAEIERVLPQGWWH